MNGYDNHNIPRPTYFKTNDVTRVFQDIVDIYGIPTYLEANPTPITMVTFPFFFGMMFGDMGHGSVVLTTGIIMCFAANKLGAAAGLRYFVLLLGCFSVYCGFIYNEFFAL